jgi:hypothetical protein
MQYALNNSSINYHYEEENEGYTTVNGIYPFTDTIMYAIMGKNINCIRTAFDMFMKEINNNGVNNWEQYFKFAAVYGSLEIIKYMITIKPYFVNEIKDFYNNILKFALCEGNIEIVKFAIINGAIYSSHLDEFVSNYNDGRCPNSIEIDEDYTNFYDLKYKCPENIEERIMECMKFIHN